MHLDGRPIETQRSERGRSKAPAAARRLPYFLDTCPILVEKHIDIVAHEGQLRGRGRHLVRPVAIENARARAAIGEFGGQAQVIGTGIDAPDDLGLAVDVTIGLFLRPLRAATQQKQGEDRNAEDGPG